MEPAGKKCTKCLQVLPETEFYADNTRRSGSSRLMSHYRYCNLNSAKSKSNAFTKHFGFCQGTAVYRKNNHGTEHRPPEGTPCAVCSRPMTYTRGADLMCFDHDPTTDTFRGWICQQCNTGIGKLGDDLDLIIHRLHQYKLHAETQAKLSPNQHPAPNRR
jgi:hypothetical protein